jgi:hypothetical protein
MPATATTSRASRNGAGTLPADRRPKKRANVLTRPQVEEIRAAEARVTAAKRRLEKATEERTLVRDRYRDRLPENEAVEAGGCLIKRIVKSTGQRFRLSEYLRHHKLRPEMRSFVTKAGTSEQWDIKALK